MLSHHVLLLLLMVQGLRLFGVHAGDMKSEVNVENYARVRQFVVMGPNLVIIIEGVG